MFEYLTFELKLNIIIFDFFLSYVHYLSKYVLLVLGCCLLNQPNFCINCDKYPANCCVVFYGSEVVSVFNFVVGTCALCE